VPNLRDIKRRITSVQKTQQITSAMRMVAAAKLRRAQESMQAARPYAQRMRDTLAEVAGAQVDAVHPLLARHESVKCLELVVVTSDRGLAGAFNANVMKCAASWLAERTSSEAPESVVVTTVGLKATEHYARHQTGEPGESYEIPGWVDYDLAAQIARRLCHRYQEGEVDEVVLVYSDFVSTLTQTPIVVPLLPLAPPELDEGPSTAGTEPKTAHNFEPGPEKLLGFLAPKAIEVEVFRALLENQAGEHAARMTAMENATRNTEELIDKLKLDFNRARQAAITKELIEIVTGAQALE
jgi:F-type H+-transporting ATPase subunit gamma